MGVIREFVRKYGGEYKEMPLKATNTTIGHYTFQPKEGHVLFNGSHLFLFINDVGGANPISEPFRMRLRLKTSTKFNLSVVTRSFWNRIFSRIHSKKKSVLPKSIRRQYKFSGSEKLIERLGNNKELMSELNSAFVYLQLNNERPDIILITPERGFAKIEDLERLARILKLVESEITF